MDPNSKITTLMEKARTAASAAGTAAVVKRDAAKAKLMEIAKNPERYIDLKLEEFNEMMKYNHDQKEDWPETVDALKGEYLDHYNLSPENKNTATAALINIQEDTKNQVNDCSLVTGFLGELAPFGQTQRRDIHKEPLKNPQQPIPTTQLQRNTLLEGLDDLYKRVEIEQKAWKSTCSVTAPIDVRAHIYDNIKLEIKNLKSELVETQNSDKVNNEGKIQQQIRNLRGYLQELNKKNEFDPNTSYPKNRLCTKQEIVEKYFQQELLLGTSNYNLEKHTRHIEVEVTNKAIKDIIDGANALSNNEGNSPQGNFKIPKPLFQIYYSIMTWGGFVHKEEMKKAIDSYHELLDTYKEVTCLKLENETGAIVEHKDTVTVDKDFIEDELNKTEEQLDKQLGQLNTIQKSNDAEIEELVEKAKATLSKTTLSKTTLSTKPDPDNNKHQEALVKYNLEVAAIDTDTNSTTDEQKAAREKKARGKLFKQADKADPNKLFQDSNKGLEKEKKATQELISDCKELKKTIEEKKEKLKTDHAANPNKEYNQKDLDAIGGDITHKSKKINKKVLANNSKTEIKKMVANTVKKPGASGTADKGGNTSYVYLETLSKFNKNTMDFNLVAVKKAFIGNELGKIKGSLNEQLKIFKDEKTKSTQNLVEEAKGILTDKSNVTEAQEIKTYDDAIKLAGTKYEKAIIHAKETAQAATGALNQTDTVINAPKLKEIRQECDKKTQTAEETKEAAEEAARTALFDKAIANEPSTSSSPLKTKIDELESKNKKTEPLIKEIKELNDQIDKDNEALGGASDGKRYTEDEYTVIAQEINAGIEKINTALNTPGDKKAPKMPSWKAHKLRTGTSAQEGFNKSVNSLNGGITSGISGQNIASVHVEKNGEITLTGKVDVIAGDSKEIWKETNEFFKREKDKAKENSDNLLNNNVDGTLRDNGKTPTATATAATAGSGAASSANPTGSNESKPGPSNILSMFDNAKVAAEKGLTPAGLTPAGQTPTPAAAAATATAT